MLINLTPNLREIEKNREIYNQHGWDYIPQCDEKLNPEVGIYMNKSLNFPFDEFEEFEGFYNNPLRVIDMENGLYKPYYVKSQQGIADNIEQVKQYFKEEIDDSTRKYFILITPVFQDKENAGQGGGWRWGGWGEYIGTLNPRYEYLDDENFGDDFEGYVLIFHIYPVE